MLTQTKIPSQIALQRKLHYMAKHLRKQMTVAEQILWLNLRKKYYFKERFRRQYPIDHYIVDFCCVKKKLVIEADGPIHLQQESRDIQRDEILGYYGYKVLRFTNEQVINETVVVIKVIQHALMESSSVS